MGSGSVPELGKCLSPDVEVRGVFEEMRKGGWDVAYSYKMAFGISIFSCISSYNYNLI